MWIWLQKSKEQPFTAHWIYEISHSAGLLRALPARSIANHWKFPSKLPTCPKFPRLQNEANTSTYIPELLRRLS